ncbi:MAG: hypothetical protein R2911_42660 [Caldilineaceae bacterium]
MADLVNGESLQYKKIWINHEWYIPVNDFGQCVGPCNEGALGFVIQLHSEVDSRQKRALKIPRLMGETPRENAYVCELMEKELAAVREVVLGTQGTRGLINADVTGGSPLRRPINTVGGSPEAELWNGALILTRYEKGQNPYFCLLLVQGNDIKHYPESADRPIKSIEEYKLIEENSQEPTKGTKWYQTVFVIAKSSIGEGSDLQGSALIHTARNAFRRGPSHAFWYVSS